MRRCQEILAPVSYFFRVTWIDKGIRGVGGTHPCRVIFGREIGRRAMAGPVTLPIRWSAMQWSHHRQT